ncbi:MAG: heavy metal translocating P-type ATPase [Bacilli bacterium]
MEKQQFQIEGMTCATCQVTVQRAVAQIQGVKQVNVNLITHAMQVEFEPTVKIQSIIKEVEEAGYGAKVISKDQPEQFRKQQKITRSLMKKRLIISFSLLLPLFYISMGMMVGLPLFSFLDLTYINLSIQWALTVPIIVVNYRYFSVGIKRLLKGDPNMDTLVAIGTGAAILYGFYITVISFYGEWIQNMDLSMIWMNQLYLESAATILSLVTLGKYLEEISKQKTLGALEKLMDLKPKKAWKKINGDTVEVLVSDLHIGDVVVVRPGELIPVDGVIQSGDTMVNQASITGESLPVHKQTGDQVIAATLNQLGAIEVEVKFLGDDTTIAKIIRLVEEASQTKAPLAKLADEISRIFVPIVLAIAFSAFLIWLLLGESIEFALQIMIAILVISCPCALGLATPVTMMVGAGKGAELGILIKSAEAMEKLHTIDTVVMDKTGTITQGKPVVVDLIIQKGYALESIKQIAASIEYHSEHPLGKAIVDAYEDQLLTVTDFVYVPGMGVRGKINNETYRLTKVSHLTDDLNKILATGKTIIELNGPQGLMAHFVIADAVKPSSIEAIHALKKLGKKLVMLTGDLKPVAQSIANDVGITEVVAEVLPQDKDAVIADLQKQGRKVVMVGDGINDAPSLMRADVGMAIGAGTDIAIDAADIVLLQSDLRQVVYAFDLSKSVVKNMKTNLFWAFFYNLIAIPLAAGVLFPFYGWLLSPMIAALAMAFSSVSVVLNALRLRSFRANIVR